MHAPSTKYRRPTILLLNKKICNQTQKKLLGAAIERKPKIENVNLAGGKLIREAKVNDNTTWTVFSKKKTTSTLLLSICTFRSIGQFRSVFGKNISKSQFLHWQNNYLSKKKNKVYLMLFCKNNPKINRKFKNI